MKLVVISGVSGSGKSTALHVLEDLGYYCIDNLPVRLLPAFAEQMNTLPGGVAQRAAVGIDARNIPEDLANFPAIRAQLSKAAIRCEIIFLDANDDVLITRFSETRRKHPLTQENTPLAEAIALERKVLEPISTSADLYVDTTYTNVHQLRELVRDRTQVAANQSVSILIESFGFKHGVPTDADFVFDVRCLPNPHWEPTLRHSTGLDQAVAEYLERQEMTGQMFDDISRFVSRWIPSILADNRSYITVAIGCTGGQHRSVYMAKRLADVLGGQYSGVATRHRDLP